LFGGYAREIRDWCELFGTAASALRPGCADDAVADDAEIERLERSVVG
jgi:hypothetical protein